jgi:transcriptional regulator with XRE-family HTH domain
MGTPGGAMYIASTLKRLREAKKLSQGDIEHRTGLLRCYISRVENGHTVPSIETLEKISRALGVRMYELFYNGENGELEQQQHSNGHKDWASSGKGKRLFVRLRNTLPKISAEDRAILLFTAHKMVHKKSRR